MRKLILLLGAGLLGATLLLAACGDDDDDAGTGGDDAGSSPAASVDGESPAAGNETAAVTIGDFFYEPDTLTAPADGTLTLEVTNGGGLPHTFTIAELDIDEPVSAGESATVTIEGAEAGEYTYMCTVHPGQMEGTLTVE